MINPPGGFKLGTDGFAVAVGAGLAGVEGGLVGVAFLSGALTGRATGFALVGTGLVAAMSNLANKLQKMMVRQSFMPAANNAG
jgi:hypothetical protein